MLGAVSDERLADELHFSNSSFEQVKLNQELELVVLDNCLRPLPN